MLCIAGSEMDLVSKMVAKQALGQYDWLVAHELQANDVFWMSPKVCSGDGARMQTLMIQSVPLFQYHDQKTW